MYKYILWDHDGVLVDTEHWYFRATQRALAELDVELSLETYLERMPSGQSCWDLAHGVSDAVIDSQRNKRDTYYQEYLTTKNIEIEGVIPVLEELSKSYRMAIVTTSRGDDFEIIHKNRNITDFMDFVIVREDYEIAKPHPEPYLTALAKFGAKPNEAIAIEDSNRGLTAAIAAKLGCVVIKNGFTAHQDFSSSKDILSSIKELPKYLESNPTA